MTDSPRVPIPANLEDASAFLAASGLHFTEVSGHLVTGTLDSAPNTTRRGASCTAASTPPR